MRQLVAENSHRRAETAGQTLTERSACKQINPNIRNQQQQEANISMKMHTFMSLFTVAEGESSWRLTLITSLF